MMHVRRRGRGESLAHTHSFRDVAAADAEKQYLHMQRPTACIRCLRGDRRGAHTCSHSMATYG